MSPTHRMSFAEAMAFVPLSDSDHGAKRLMAQQAAWFPGKGLSWEGESIVGLAQRRKGKGVTAAGIHVFAQAPLAAARMVEQEERETGATAAKIGIHVSESLRMTT